uniref:Dehydrodolichyl diphosphate synthase subunit n=1 Tax=Phocoena sinus TaxID=42100 RepID=A0A8C9B0E0_PHOSS
MNHREDLQGYLLNLFLQSQSPSLKRPLQRHRKLKVLEMPSEVCIFDNCVLLVTVQFEILFFIKFYKNAEFCFTFFFLSYVVSIQNTSLLFFGGRAHVTNRLSLKLD